MAVATTPIQGVLRDAQGLLYEGALIEVYLNTQMIYSGATIGNLADRTYTNSYGTFYLNLSPSTSDAVRENWYTFKIVMDTTTYYNKIVPSSLSVINFDNLTDYIMPALRTPLLGGLNKNINTSPVTVPNDYAGTFTWEAFTADGATRIFTAPGDIYLVALNGVLQSPGTTGDYVLLNANTIEFNIAPALNDLVLIQYKI